ncbi:hypothetical protein Pelo_17207 [Pelomyxa schiedti]|nr:hypothetical protein Pelo_17207 [Pelomyxa schiedti]
MQPGNDGTGVATGTQNVAAVPPSTNNAYQQQQQQLLIHQQQQQQQLQQLHQQLQQHQQQSFYPMPIGAQQQPQGYPTPITIPAAAYMPVTHPPPPPLQQINISGNLADNTAAAYPTTSATPGSFSGPCRCGCGGVGCCQANNLNSGAGGDMLSSATQAAMAVAALLNMRGEAGGKYPPYNPGSEASHCSSLPPGSDKSFPSPSQGPVPAPQQPLPPQQPGLQPQQPLLQPQQTVGPPQQPLVSQQVPPSPQEKPVVSGKSHTKRGNTNHRGPSVDRFCEFCGSTTTPVWRRGPSGKTTLCNACGIKWRVKNQHATAQGGSPTPRKSNSQQTNCPKAKRSRIGHSKKSSPVSTVAPPPPSTEQTVVSINPQNQATQVQEDSCQMSTDSAFSASNETLAAQLSLLYSQLLTDSVGSQTQLTLPQPQIQQPFSFPQMQVHVQLKQEQSPPSNTEPEVASSKKSPTEQGIGSGENQTSDIPPTQSSPSPQAPPKPHAHKHRHKRKTRYGATHTSENDTGSPHDNSDETLLPTEVPSSQTELQQTTEIKNEPREEAPLELEPLPIEQNQTEKTGPAQNPPIPKEEPQHLQDKLQHLQLRQPESPQAGAALSPHRTCSISELLNGESSGATAVKTETPQAQSQSTPEQASSALNTNNSKRRKVSDMVWPFIPPSSPSPPSPWSSPRSSPRSPLRTATEAPVPQSSPQPTTPHLLSTPQSPQTPKATPHSLMHGTDVIPAELVIPNPHPSPNSSSNTTTSTATTGTQTNNTGSNSNSNSNSKRSTVCPVSTPSPPSSPLSLVASGVPPPPLTLTSSTASSSTSSSTSAAATPAPLSALCGDTGCSLLSS